MRYTPVRGGGGGGSRDDQDDSDESSFSARGGTTGSAMDDEQQEDEVAEQELVTDDDTDDSQSLSDAENDTAESSFSARGGTTGSAMDDTAESSFSARGGTTGDAMADIEEARGELRRDAAEQSRFDEDELTISLDGVSGELQADVRDEVVEEEVRQEVLDDIETGVLGTQAGVDPERVQVERTDDGVEVEIERESGLSGVGAIIRGEQTNRDFLVAEDERFRRTFAEPPADFVDGDRSARTAGSGFVEEGVASFSLAGAAVFADDAQTEFREATVAGPGGSIMLSPTDEQRETLEGFSDELASQSSDPDPETIGRAGGATAAVLAPLGAPRVARGARDRTPDVDLQLGQFRADDTGMVRLDQRQRRSSDSDAGQRTIERDSPEADPSDPTVSERVDEITERWGGEGTMTRADRGLDESIVVEPTQRGRSRQSPEDQLPPREEFPSDAAFQRELDALRARQADDVGTTTTRTQDASAAATSPQRSGAAGTAAFRGRSGQFGTAAAAAATPAEDAGTETGTFADTDSVFGFGSASDADSGFAGRVDSAFGVAGSGATTDTTQSVTQTQDQLFGQQQGQQTQQRQHGRGRSTRRFGFGDREHEGDDDLFGFDFDDAAFETGIADADDLFGNGR